MDQELLKQQIEAGKRAREAFEFLRDETHPHFWYTLKVLVQSKIPTEEPESGMTYEQATSFEREMMPFGKYKGVPVGSITMDYLCSLLDPSPFVNKLRKYVQWRNKYEHD